jgi:hypothetical protein
MFRLRPSSGSLYLSLAKVTITKMFRKILAIVTLARLKYKLPDDGHRLKHAGAF